MSVYSWLQIGLYLAVLILLVKPLGWYMAQVYEGKPCGLDRVVGWLERLIYRVCRIDPTEEMSWVAYAKAMLVFNLLGILAVYGLQRIQQFLPLNPRAHGGRAARSGHEHGRQLRHEHQLAELRRRDDPELPDANARPDGAELRLGGHGHGHPGGDDPRVRAALAARRSATSGTTWSAARCIS